MSVVAPELAERLRAVLAARDEVLEAYLFGSRARGGGRPDSDVDVAVYVDAAQVRPAPFGYEAELSALCMSALGVDDVDVVRLDRAGPVLYHRVLRDGVRVFTRDPRRTTAREGYALSRYCDYLPQLAKIDRAAARRIRGGEFGR